MPVGTTAEHEDLRRTVRRWTDAHCPPEVPRAMFETDATEVPKAFTELAGQGWLGLHVGEEHGGEGFGLVELAVVVEELGRALLPGPLLSSLVVSATLARAGGEAAKAALPGLADGSETAGVHLGAGSLQARDDQGSLVVSGELSPVVGAPGARWLLLPVDGRGWCLLDAASDPVEVSPLDVLDPTRPLGAVTVRDAAVADARVLADLEPGTVGDLALVIEAAEAAGAARWCLDTASDYAKVRVQFGRPIGQFQAIKHKLADMLVVVEQMEALAWDAAVAWDDAHDGDAGPRALAAAIAGSVCLEGLADCAKDCVQILGGIGFTWEHDAHLYLRRAMSDRQLLGAGGAPGPGPLAQTVADLALAGARRPLAAALPEGAEAIRAEIAPMVAEVAALEGDAQRAAMVSAGLVAPHWPRPWGRESSPLEQLVIDEELAAAGLHRPHIAVGAWALPTLISHGSVEQQERWVGPTLLGELWWCQLFSEPGAGSDLASLATRADKVDGGWVLNGQKVWTSMAQRADWGICLARTDPTVPKHQGITYFVVDMRSEGVDVRPLRELTGQALFNEVFLTDVFVGDDCVVGQPGGGWAIARTTLANERVSMSSGSTFGTGVEQVLRRLTKLGESAPAGSAVAVGALLAEAQALRLMGHRATLRSLSGTDPGPGASVRKLLGAEHEQRVQEIGLALAGPAGAVLDGKDRRWIDGFLATRCLTIAGGTSEVQRNVMAERILGQPRDPEPGS
jgi:alkylation response protein AidB-like acyl-CoA dehydrogenase